LITFIAQIIVLLDAVPDEIFAVCRRRLTMVVEVEQAFSADGGKTWEPNWIATFTKLKQ